jgi:hypothetical protein
MALRTAARTAVGSAAAIVLGAIAACRSKPAAGGACRVVDQLACVARDRARECQAPSPRPPSSDGEGGPGGAGTGGGRAGASPTHLEWAEVPCHGPRGCATATSAGDDCDDTIAEEGDACPHSPPLDYACTVDKTRALVCKDGRYELWRACRGPQGCAVEGGRNVRCDTTLGSSGDPCAQRGTYACAADRTSMLVCDGARLGVASTCRGPGACQADRDSRRVDCDDSVAAEGDACDREDRIACATDGKAELVCTHGHFARKRECRRTDCRLDGTKLYCD